MRSGQLPQLFFDHRQAGIAADTVKAREHAFDVAIHDGEGIIPGLAQDGACSAPADAWQREQCIEVAR